MPSVREGPPLPPPSSGLWGILERHPAALLGSLVQKALSERHFLQGTVFSSLLGTPEVQS